MKNKMMLAMIIMMACLGCLSNQAQAKSSVIKLKPGKIYKYDVNNDGKRDKIRVQIVSEYGNGDVAKKCVYVNDKKSLTAQGGKGVDIYLFTKNKKGVFIHSRIGTGPNHLTYYTYKNKKYKKKRFPFNCNGYAFEVPTAVGNELKITYGIKSWYRDSFDSNDNDPFSAVMTYKLSKGKFKNTQKYAKVRGKKNYIALNTFRTGKTLSSISKGNGPIVHSGDKVTFVNEVIKKINKQHHRCYKIRVGKKYGWFEDSTVIKFKRWENQTTDNDDPNNTNNTETATYMLSAVSIEDFELQNSVLRVSTSDTIEENDKTTTIKSLTLDVDSSCEWHYVNAGIRYPQNEVDETITFQDLVEYINNVKGLPENGYYSLKIYVENGKVKKVAFQCM